MSIQASQYKYWIRTPVGLENIVLGELYDRMQVYKFAKKHRSLFVDGDITIKNEQNFLKKIRTADDIYRFIGIYEGVNNTKASVNRFLEYFEKNTIPVLRKKKKSEYFRATVSFLGKRNFNRFFVENELNKLVAKHTHFKALSNERGDVWHEGELKLRCHIEGIEAYLGISIFDIPAHKRPWRSHKYSAQLAPPIAAAMVRVAQQLEPHTVIDPFCGSGTILIESALVSPEIRHYGFDLNKEAIRVAKQNADAAGLKTEFSLKNAFDHSINYKNSVIISNPPWGDKHLIENNEGSFLAKLYEIISISSGAVLIIPEKLVSVLKENELNLKEVAQTRVRGKIAIIVMIYGV